MSGGFRSRAKGNGTQPQQQSQGAPRSQGAATPKQRANRAQQPARARNNRAQGKHNPQGSIVAQVQGNVDLPRKIALEVLYRVNEEGAYANLLLPKQLKHYKVRGRDAAFCTEITYGTLRQQGICDAIISDCATRELASLHPVVRNSLRLGIYQLLYTRVGAHAAVDSSVEMVDPKARGFCNAILRKVSRHSRDYWLEHLAPQDELARLAWQHAHPAWIAASFARLLPAGELEAALDADSQRPQVHLAAKPQELSNEELALITGGEMAQYSPYGVYLPQGAPGELDVIRQGLALVQDEGSQLIARAVTKAPLAHAETASEAAAPETGAQRWLDLCAGPGGKATMLGALAQGRAQVDAVEVSAHRADLVRQATQGLPVTVHTADGRNPGLDPGYDRILVDAPCSGLGALRRRPEARWRKSEADIVELTTLQFALLKQAYSLLRPGGALIYSTCSPDLRETRDIVDRAVRELGAIESDALQLAPELPANAQSDVTGQAVQLWPHRHGTDAMFFAWLSKPVE